MRVGLHKPHNQSRACEISGMFANVIYIRCRCVIFMYTIWLENDLKENLYVFDNV